MDSSDDYPFDDIVLDDQTLAILDQSEQKYLKESSVAVIPAVSNEPVNKRLKTSAGWTPGPGASRNGDDELPEISLHGDGTYGVNNRASFIKDVGQESLPQDFNYSTRSSKPSNNKGHQSVQPSGSYLANSRPTYPANYRQRQHQQTTFAPNRDPNSRAAKDSNPQSSAAISQLLELQKKLDELREENSKMKSALQEAVDNKLAKDGEVSILRKNIEKSAQNHAAQILQLKSEKDKADAKQLQMQKEMKDEIERLRTQFVFRQQEFESSIRKPPPSVRAKRVGREFPSTPLALPAAISSWNKGPTKPIEGTPVRPARLPSSLNKLSPTRQVRKSPEKIKSGMLPGFENAFETSTPRKSPSKRSARPNEQRIEPPIFGTATTNAQRLPSQLSQGPSQFQSEPLARQTGHQEMFALNEPNRSALFEQSQANTNEMDVMPMESDEDIVSEELEIFEPINWKAELCRIILTHSYGLKGEISFQRLLGLSHFSASTNDYATSCGRILEVISNSARSDDYNNSIKVVSMSFLSLLVTLNDVQAQDTLSIIFNLLTKLVVSLPTFQSSLLSCQLPLRDNHPLTIVEVVCSTVLKYLQPTSQSHDDLAAEAMSFLDSLCFHVDAKIMERLEPLVRNREVLMTLLHPSQSSWFLERSSRLLVLLSTYCDLYKVLLDTPDAGLEPNIEVQMKDALSERLCSHLIDSNKPPSSDFRTYILTYLAQLSLSHPSAHSFLGASYALIPSLVLYISQLTSPLWEDDGSLACSVENTASMVKALNQATFLLYHLIFGIEPNLNLRYTLQHAPHRPFNSISHIFVVTFGRLSYSEPPSWIETPKRQELEFLAEIAREILEVVVDGPEGDSVWAAFQTEPDEDNMIEEEMEAQLMGINVG